MNPDLDATTLSDIETKLAGCRISGLHFHSNDIEPGNLFVAIRGTHSDGHQYIEQAIKKGAAAVIGEKDISALPVPYIRVANARRVLALLASKFYNYPSRKHTVIGITGTNGKTSTAYLLRHIIQTSGTRCSLFGTVEHIINGRKILSKNTTPDALSLQKWMNESNDPVVIMEASSHGIDQERIYGIALDCAVFTNLSHDHLNYHRQMNDYFEVKSSLFKQLKTSGTAIINGDDAWGKSLLERLRAEHTPLKSFGVSESCDLQLIDIKERWQPRCQMKEGGKTYSFRLPLPGKHNIYNAMAAYLVARCLHIDPQTIIHALQTFPGVPGRAEKYIHPHGATFIIDYAHTPQGLDQFLGSLKRCGAKHLIHIFGFRGNGDPSKREKMIHISNKYSDALILTMDDLGPVKAEEMTEQLKQLSRIGAKRHCTIIEDRTLAIQHAWRQAKEKDWIVVTGKGPETYEQSFTLPTRSDRETILYLLNEADKSSKASINRSISKPDPDQPEYHPAFQYQPINGPFPEKHPPPFVPQQTVADELYWPDE